MAFGNCAWICVFSGPNWKSHDKDGNKVLVKKELMGKRFGQETVCSKSFEAKKKSSIMLRQ